MPKKNVKKKTYGTSNRFQLFKLFRCGLGKCVVLAVNIVMPCRFFLDIVQIFCSMSETFVQSHFEQRA